MNYSLSISEAAELDIRDAFLWYEDQKDNLGLTFEKHISKTIQNINFVELLSVGSEKSPEDSNSIQPNQSRFSKEISLRCAF
ncbi:MAG: hypothetical protein ACQERC_07565 [Bacteroidota bacterium]